MRPYDPVRVASSIRLPQFFTAVLCADWPWMRAWPHDAGHSDRSSVTVQRQRRRERVDRVQAKTLVFAMQVPSSTACLEGIHAFVEIGAAHLNPRPPQYLFGSDIAFPSASSSQPVDAFAWRTVRGPTKT
jgi:hypothetical protein